MERATLTCTARKLYCIS